MNGSIIYEPSIGGSSRYNSKIAQEFTIESTYYLPLKLLNLKNLKIKSFFKNRSPGMILTSMEPNIFRMLFSIKNQKNMML